MRTGLLLLLLLAVLPNRLWAQHTSPLSREERRAAIEAESRAWESLGAEERRVIVRRSRYIYRFGDNLIIDAYEMLHWQDEAQGRVNRTIKDGREQFRYRQDDRYRALCADKRNLASFWYRGKLLNDPDVRRSLSPQTDFPEFAHALMHQVQQLEDDQAIGTEARTSEVIEAHLYKTLPVVYAADPRTLRERRSSTNGWNLFSAVKDSELGVEMRFGAGFLGSGLAPEQGIQRDRASMRTRDIRLKYLGFVTSPLNDDELPIKGRSMFVPVASGTRIWEPDATTGPLSEKITYYKVEDLDRFRMMPRQVARAFVEGKMEIRHREVQRVDGQFKSILKALERPEQDPD